MSAAYKKAHTYTRTRAHAHTRTRTHTHTRTRTRTRAHTRTRTRTHAHAHAHTAQTNTLTLSDEGRAADGHGVRNGEVGSKRRAQEAIGSDAAHLSTNHSLLARAHTNGRGIVAVLSMGRDKRSKVSGFLFVCACFCACVCVFV